MTNIIRVTDELAPSEVAEIHEARARRLMAERAGLPLNWQTRARHRELAVEIQDALDRFNRANEAQPEHSS